MPLPTPPARLAAVEQLLDTTLPPGLLPETQEALWEWSQRPRRFGGQAAEPGPLPVPFPYQSLPPSACLAYELVSWANIPAYLPLFADDPSPFVEARFKQRAALEMYAVDLLTDTRYSWKHGGCDWLLRQHSDGQAVGVLHLYHLSHERAGDWVPHCAVGYALAVPFRRQGYGFEALSHLLQRAAALFGRTEARALSVAENLASEALLRKCGFTLLEQRPATYSQGAVRLWQRGLLDFR